MNSQDYSEMNQDELNNISVKELRTYISKNKIGKNLGKLKKSELVEIILNQSLGDPPGDPPGETPGDPLEFSDEDNIPVPVINTYYTFTQSQLLTLISELKKL
jgi:hypothetical protein